MTTSEITTNSKKSPVINELTSLRGIFMMTIFLHHIPLYDGAGYMAVSFFFVLSGFSLTLGYGDRIDNNQFSYHQYVKRRFARLYPIHWLCLIAIMPLVLLSIYSGGIDMREELAIFFLNSSLLQSLVPIKAVYFSFNGVSWYLSDIMVMAILFPFLYRIIKRMSYLMNYAILLALVVAYTLLIKVLPIDWHHAILYINPVPRLIDFVLGICAALLFLHWDDLRLLDKTVINKKSLFIAMGVVSFLIIITISVTCSIDNPYSIALYYWLPASLLIFSVSAVSRLGGAFLLNNKYLIYLGDISLSFFMIHQIVIRFARLLHKLLCLTDDICSPPWIVSIFIIVLLLSHCLNRYFEKPVAKWLTRK